MTQYVDLGITLTTYTNMIDYLENHVQYLDNYYEIAELIHLIDYLEREKAEDEGRKNKELYESFENEKKVNEFLKEYKTLINELISDENLYELNYFLIDTVNVFEDRYTPNQLILLSCLYFLSNDENFELVDYEETLDDYDLSTDDLIKFLTRVSKYYKNR